MRKKTTRIPWPDLPMRNRSQISIKACGRVQKPTQTAPQTRGPRGPGRGLDPKPSLLPTIIHQQGGKRVQEHCVFYACRVTLPCFSSSLLCNVSYSGCEVAPSYAPFSPQCSPCAPRAMTVNRHGDFVGSRGETRDQSTAENRGLLPSVTLHFHSSSASSGEDVDSCGGRQHTYKKVQAIGPFC